MDLEKVPASHEPSTPPHRVQPGEAEAEAGAGANATGASPKNVVLDKEDGDKEESSINTTAVEDNKLAAGEAEEERLEEDATRLETPPEAKRSKGRTALIMSALCVGVLIFRENLMLMQYNRWQSF
jgi:hypothetical protein